MKFWKWNDREFDSVEDAMDKVEEFSNQGRSTRVIINDNGTVSVGIQAATNEPPASNIDGDGGLITLLGDFAG